MVGVRERELRWRIKETVTLSMRPCCGHAASELQKTLLSPPSPRIIKSVGWIGMTSFSVQYQLRNNTTVSTPSLEVNDRWDLHTALLYWLCKRSLLSNKSTEIELYMVCAIVNLPSCKIGSKIVFEDAFLDMTDKSLDMVPFSKMLG